MNIGKIIDQDFKIWKGKTSFVINVQGCNMACPYCNNKDCVKNALSKKDWRPAFEQVKHSVNSVVITGGEPLIQQHLSIFCKKIKLAGMKVRLETNGSNPEVLSQLIQRKVVDSVALDIKAPFNDYPRIAKSGDSMKVKKSMDLLQNSKVEHEFRTTWTPDLTEEQLLAIARQCKGIWILQQFIPGNCLNPSYDTKPLTPYEQILNLAKKAEGPTEKRILSEKGEEVV
ncbi:anaerobic ribonucleoside-triphosphate reductase activating protein [archaeon]|nr:anaerobic ribonucleoside-triphosphate reductase activating protein [archaeon]